MARVVVTGASGFVGTHLVERLVRDGDEVTAFDNGENPQGDAIAATAARYVQGDIRDPEQVARAIGKGVDTVYHLAAIVGVDRYLDRPLDVLDVNVMGTRNVLQAALDRGAKVLVASTSEIFGKNPAVPWTEDADRVLGSTATGRWSYSSSKAVAEHLTYAFIRQHGLRATIVRYFNLYGPRQRPAFVVSRSIHRALRGIAPVVYDDGGQTRSFTFIDDVIGATVLAATSEKADGESFNLGSMEETSVQSVVQLIATATGMEATVRPIDTRKRFGENYQDLARRMPDTRKVCEVLGWRATTKLRDGVPATIEWARANPWWLATADSGAS